MTFNECESVHCIRCLDRAAAWVYECGGEREWFLCVRQRLLVCFFFLARVFESDWTRPFLAREERKFWYATLVSGRKKTTLRGLPGSHQFLSYAAENKTMLVKGVYMKQVDIDSHTVFTIHLYAQHVKRRWNRIESFQLRICAMSESAIWNTCWRSRTRIFWDGGSKYFQASSTSS